MKSIRRKIVSLINLGSNKVCVVSLTKIFIFFNYVNLNRFLKNNLNKWKMQMTKISLILLGASTKGGLGKGLYGIKFIMTATLIF